MKLSPLLCITVSLLAGCGKQVASEVKVERPALTLVVGAAAADVGNIYSGEIRARHETQMGFRIAGKLVERLVDVGVQVQAGQVLARLDGGDAALQANSAQAQQQLAEAEVRRYRELRSKGFVSQSALDAKEAALKAASAQAGLARNQTDYTVLRADRSGVVAAVLAEPGQVLSVGQAVLRVAQDGEREVALALPEAQRAKIKLGAAAEITLLADGGAGVKLNGHLRELSPAADPVSRTYAARVSLTQRVPELALGMTASVRFIAAEKNTGLIIPLTAIFQQGVQTAVWIVASDHSISLRTVKVVAYRDGGAVIADGLVAGERIVSNGVHRLSAGEKIRSIEGGAASSGANGGGQ